MSDVFLVIKLRLCILEVRISQSVKHIRRRTMSGCLITDDRANFGAGSQEEAQIGWKISGVPAWDRTGMQKRIQTRDRALGA